MYILNLVTLDVNECQSEDNHSCHSKATCFNNVGSYTCSCIDGYSGDGFTCIGNVYIGYFNLFVKLAVHKFM